MVSCETVTDYHSNQQIKTLLFRRASCTRRHDPVIKFHSPKPSSAQTPRARRNCQTRKLTRRNKQSLNQIQEAGAKRRTCRPKVQTVAQKSKEAALKQSQLQAS